MSNCAVVCRSVSGANAVPCVSWAAIGWLRTRHTSTSRLWWLTRTTRWSAATQTHSGCARASPSTASCVASLPPERSHVVPARDIASMARLAAHGGRLGSATTRCSCVGNDKDITISSVWCNRWQIKILLHPLLLSSVSIWKEYHSRLQPYWLILIVSCSFLYPHSAIHNHTFKYTWGNNDIDIKSHSSVPKDVYGAVINFLTIISPIITHQCSCIFHQSVNSHQIPWIIMSSHMMLAVIKFLWSLG